MKILLCNEAFIGDLILSTVVLKPLKRAYPEAKIGFLTGSWARQVVDDHVLIDYVHVYDQESFNRERKSKISKKMQEHTTKKKVVKEIEAVQYDMAIDLHSYYKENSAHILYKLGIPKRVGYWTCKKPFFYNEIFTHWDCRYFHMLENHLVMLEALGVEIKPSDFYPFLEYKNQGESIRNLPDDYLVLHMGTGELCREWDEAHWITLAKDLEKLGFALVFIGKGERERARIQEVTKNLKTFHNFCDKLSWKQVISVIKKAKFLIGLESMAGHLAAYAGIPALLIYAGPLPINWRPYHTYSQIIKPKECYLKEWKKIFPKEPISTITPLEVFEKALKIMEAHKIL